MKGKTQQAAAAASDMSERSVRNWNKGPLPSEKKDRRRKSYETGTRSPVCGRRK